MITKFKPKDMVRIKPSFKKRCIPAISRQGIYGVILAIDLEFAQQQRVNGNYYRICWHGKNKKPLGRWYNNTRIAEEALMMRTKFVRRHPLTNFFREK